MAYHNFRDFSSVARMLSSQLKGPESFPTPAMGIIGFSDSVYPSHFRPNSYLEGSLCRMSNGTVEEKHQDYRPDVPPHVIKWR